MYLVYSGIAILAVCLTLFLSWPTKPPPSIRFDSKTPAELLILAENGNAEAQYWIGWKYEQGEGVEQDYEQAATWYRKAAEAGSAGAQNQLSLLYEDGLGVERNLSEAVRWAQKAAEQDTPTAMGNLGRLYANGVGVEQDYVKAAEWYRKAAQRGFAPAQNNLANLYSRGIGVPKDLAEAFKLKRQAAEAGLAEAESSLGTMYFEGLGTDRDYVEAGYWYRRAADQGLPQPAAYLKSALNICTAPSGTPEKEEHCLVAAGAGFAAGQYALGVYYDAGHFVEQDFEKAVEWSRKAAEQGHPLAQALLSKALAEGKGVTRDDAEAYAWVSVLELHRPEKESEAAVVKLATIFKKVLFQRMSEKERSRATELSHEYIDKYSAQPPT